MKTGSSVVFPIMKNLNICTSSLIFPNFCIQEPFFAVTIFYICLERLDMVSNISLSDIYYDIILDFKVSYTILTL